MQQYELVFEGHHKAIIGLLEGFILASGKNWEYIFSDEAGIKSETFAAMLLEWIALKSKMHHVILSEDFAKTVKAALDKKSLVEKGITLKSFLPIKEASFFFEAKTFGKPYADEIKSLLNTLPEGVQLLNYNPVETQDKDAKGVELYTPVHEFMFEATGVIKGDVAALVALRKKFSQQPLIQMRDIEIKF